MLDYDLNPAWTFFFKCFFFSFFFCLSEDMWERYDAAFNKIWAASAFKGITILSTFLLILGSELTHHIELSKYYHSLYKRNFT